MKCKSVSTNKIIIESMSEKDTFNLGVLLSKVAFPKLVIYLNGELGAGKTHLTQGIAFGLGIKGIKSPSFIIVAEHNSGKIPLAHVDLYRLQTQSEVEELDLEYYVDQNYLLIIEWSERWTEKPKAESVEINIKYTEHDNIRTIEIISSLEKIISHLKMLLTNIKI
ncbi:MAG: tRNA (adenosine(37)-N6)-threonylcarbamoyltransferase complex ATPase subunit type 1 TsaE [Synergistaceae bacterium]